MTDTPHKHRKPVEGSPSLEHGDTLGRLIRLADSGPVIPADGAERVKALVRPRWRQEVRARRVRRGLLWGGAAVAAAATVFLALNLAPRTEWFSVPDGTPIARVAMIAGDVEVVPPGDGAEAVDGALLGTVVHEGVWLRTSTSSRVALELVGGQSLRLDRDTRLRLESAEVMVLDRGAVYVDSAQAGLTVRTAMGGARDIGTQFEVRSEHGTLTIRVRDGAVALSREDGDLEVTRGASVTIAADGSRIMDETPSWGPEWAWVQEVAPAIDIEGRSVVAFLDWVSRETGLWVHYADREVEDFAGATVLHGTIQGLMPAQAPEVVLPGCGLRVSERSGTLEIRRADSS